MAYTSDLNNKHQCIIWQDEGDSTEAVLVTPEASGNLVWLQLQQGENWVNLNVEGAKELIKKLQWFVKNQEVVVKEWK